MSQNELKNHDVMRAVNPGRLLGDMILSDTSNIHAIGKLFDDLGHERRLQVVYGLNGKHMAALWNLADGESVMVDDLVPPKVAPLKIVRHFGKNSLPVFTRFEKRFCKPAPYSDGEKPDDGGVVLWGYNESPMRFLVGPGYFVCRIVEGDPRGRFMIDYYDVPPERPPGWPEIKPNDHGLAKGVYGFMHDFLRKVSTHVTIGRAYKNNKETNNYFLLCREPQT